MLSLLSLLITSKFVLAETTNVTLVCDTVLKGHETYCSSDGTDCDPKRKISDTGMSSVIDIIISNDEFKHVDFYQGAVMEEGMRRARLNVRDGLDTTNIIKADFKSDDFVNYGDITVDRVTGAFSFDEYQKHPATSFTYYWSGTCELKKKLF